MLTFSPVVYIPHGKNEIAEEVIKIETITGKAIKLTRTHMILSGDCESELKLFMAKEVKIGFCVRTIDGFLSVTNSIITIYNDIHLGIEKVSDISKTSEIGMYTLVTSEELIVVDGIIASPYAV